MLKIDFSTSIIKKRGLKKFFLLENIG